MVEQTITDNKQLNNYAVKDMCSGHEKVNQGDEVWDIKVNYEFAKNRKVWKLSKHLRYFFCYEYIVPICQRNMVANFTSLHD